MIRITEDLIAKGHAYSANDGVYFEVNSAPEKYGQLTGQNIDAVRSGAGGRVEDTGSGKKRSQGFCFMEVSKTWRADLGFSMGTRQTWLAY